jgi:hypothetical protein
MARQAPASAGYFEHTLRGKVAQRIEMTEEQPMPRGVGLAVHFDVDCIDFTDAPLATTILGAAKITGKTSGGWTLAAAATNDRGVTAELALRAGWSEADMADRLEARLEERMEDADAPLSDLSFLWDDSARGPW